MSIKRMNPAGSRGPEANSAALEIRAQRGPKRRLKEKQIAYQIFYSILTVIENKQPGNQMAKQNKNGKPLLQARIEHSDYSDFESLGGKLGLSLADYTRILVKREVKSKAVYNSMAAIQAGE